MKNFGDFILRLIFPLLAGLFMALFFNSFFQLRELRKKVCPTSGTVIVLDTFYIFINKPVPKPYHIVDSIPNILDTTLNTDSIYYRYLAVNYYSDTIEDTNIVAIIDEIICENEMKSRDFKYKLLRPSEIIINNPAPIHYSNGFYAGLISNYYDSKVGFGVSVGYLTKKGSFFKASYDPVHNIPSIGVMKLLK